MPGKVAPAEDGGRLLGLVPESLENIAEGTLDDRIIAARGDMVLHAFNRAELGLDPEAPLTKAGEPYSEADMIEELSRQHNLSDEIARLVVHASKYTLQQSNDVE